jgi:hypothetical protein
MFSCLSYHYVSHEVIYTLLIPSCPPIEHFLCPHCCKLKIFHSNCFDHAPRNAGSLGGHFKMAAGSLSRHHIVWQIKIKIMENWLYLGTIPVCLHIVPWRLVSTSLYVGGVKISCGLLPTGFSSNFVLTSIACS